MADFNMDMTNDLPNHLHVDIANRFNVVIGRIESGLSLRVYPRTNGELWDSPFVTFDVDEAEIAALEAEMADV